MPEIRYARNGDVEIAYETFGDPATGDPLLLVMGLDFQMVWWPDGFCQALADAGFAVTRFDNRDTGLSTKFASPARRNPFQALLGGVRPVYSSLDLVADTLAVMDAVGARSAHVMGASMGAAIAQLVALNHPDRTRSLTSVMGLPLDASGPRIMTRYLSLGVFGQFRHLPKGDDPASRVETLVAISRIMYGTHYPFPEDWAREAARISDERSPRDPTTAQRQTAARRGLRMPPLEGMTVPTLVVHGEADPLVKVAGGRDTAARIPGSELVTYPGMGHAITRELWPDLVARIRANADRAAVRPA